MLNHVTCLISTIRCSSQVLKMIEIIKWIVIFVTFILAGISTCKILKSDKS